MVLVEPFSPLRLADVLVSCLAAVQSKDNPLGLHPVSKAAVLVVDGLGAKNLRDRAGHARGLVGAWSKRGLTADSGFPSTTASALTSLTTGVGAGQHGIVGYTVRDPRSLQVINHLKQWTPHVDPDVWQRGTTVFERAASAGIPSLALGETRFQGSDFTRATWRGARFEGVGSLLEQGRAMREFFDSTTRALCYLYWPALDRTGHSGGVSSDAWIHRLEELDNDIQQLAQMLGDDEGLIVTSDHGMVDVSADSKLMVAEGSPLLEGVNAFAGEPRAPQLYVDDKVARADLLAAWSETLGSRAVVLTRDQIVDEALVGVVHPEVAPRIGDIVIACLETLVVYRESTSSPMSKAMIGQHGSFTTDEREIPVIPLGSWA